MSKKVAVELTPAEMAAVISALAFVDAGGGIDGEHINQARARERALRKLTAAGGRS